MNLITKLITLSLIILFLSCEKKEKNISINHQPINFIITDSTQHDVAFIKDKFYAITVMQKGVDVEVLLYNSKNELIEKMDSPNGASGPEEIYFYCEKTETYSIHIKRFSENKNTTEGNYSIAIKELPTKTDLTLGRAKYLEDFQAFRDIFESANSGLYRYHSKQEVDSVFSINKQKINNETSFREFYGIIWDVIDYTGSCHNNLNYPESLKIPLRRKEVFFPLPLKYIEDKIYSNLEYKDIPAGSEIISINGLNAEEFVLKVSKFRSTDGFNKTSKYAYIQTRALPTYIYRAFGEKDEFIIEYKNNNEIKSSIVKSTTHHTFLKNYTKRHSKELDEKITKDYQYDFIDSLNVGILTVKSFDVDEKSDELYIKYETFLDSVFTHIDKKTNLIVDIRGNGGGSGDALMLLTSYLTNRNVRENSQAYTLFEEVPFPEFYMDSKKGTEGFLSEHYNDNKEGKFYQNTAFNPFWEPNKNVYQKPFILLIDPFVASAASHFAAHIKSDRKATIIGNETGGGYYGHTGHFSVSYALPNSKIVLSFSIVNLEQDVVKLSDEFLGNGVIPDFKIFQTYEDFISNEDTQLNLAFEYVKKMSK